MSAAASLARARAAGAWPEIVFWLVAFAALVRACRQAAAAERDRDPRPVRAVARPDPRLRRHRLARPRRVLRLRRLCRRRCSAKTVMPDPTVGPRSSPSSSRPCSASLTSFLVLRGSDLTRLMVTLGVALMLYELANSSAGLTGGADGLQGMMVGPLLGTLRLRPLRPHRLRLQPDDAVRAVPARAADRALAVRPVADGDPRQPPARGGARHAGPSRA